MAYGGAQELFRITPDLTALGKIIGGGLPLAAYGGRADIMDTVAPVGPVYQAGTLSGNPLAVAAGLAQLTLLEEQKDTLYTDLHHKMHTLAHATKETAARLGIPHRINRLGSMMTLFFTDTKVTDFATAKTSRHRPLRGLLPGAAGAGRLLRAVAVRGRVRQHGAHRRRSWTRRPRPSSRRCMSWLDLPARGRAGRHRRPRPAVCRDLAARWAMSPDEPPVRRDADDPAPCRPLLRDVPRRDAASASWISRPARRTSPARCMRWGRRRGLDLTVVGVDNHAGHAADGAGDAPGRLIWSRPTRCACPSRPRSFDLALCALAFHHFGFEPSARVLRAMDALTTRGFVVSDLRRDRLTLWGVQAGWR